MLFTIVTVTRNNRAGLAKTAQSLAAQESDDFEWLIIDGHSTDGSQKDFAQYARDQNAVIVSEEDEGPYDAMNKGIEKAKGDYILFLNAGDALAQTQILQKIKDAVQYSHPDFIYGDSWEFSKGRTWYKPARSHEKIGKGMFTHHQSMFYKRSLISDKRYDMGYKIAADYDFTLRFLNTAQTSLYLSYPVSVFEAGGISQRRVALGRKEQFAIRQKYKITSAPRNVATYAAQAASWGLRSCAPQLYWKLKGANPEERPPSPAQPEREA